MREKSSSDRTEKNRSMGNTEWGYAYIDGGWSAKRKTESTDWVASVLKSISKKVQ